MTSYIMVSLAFVNRVTPAGPDCLDALARLVHGEVTVYYACVCVDSDERHAWQWEREDCAMCGGGQGGYRHRLAGTASLCAKHWEQVDSDDNPDTRDAPCHDQQ